MNSPRVLELTWEYPPHLEGGLGNHVGALVPALAELGARVQVVTPQLAGGELSESQPNVSVLRVPPTSRHDDFAEFVRRVNIALYSAVERLMEAGERFEVIHAHDWLVGGAAIAAKHALKTPLVATIHATERGRNRGTIQSGLSQAISRAEWDLTFEAWRVITVSNAMAAELRSFFSLPADKLDVIPNAVDMARYAGLGKESLQSFRRQFAADDEPLVFNVGRVVYEKGTHILIEAMPRVLASCSRARLVLAGRGNMVDTLRLRADALGFADRCLFAGFIPDTDRDALYAVSDCAVFPSLYEPFGIVALEAMAAGCPVVVSDVGGLAEVVRHQQTGLVVPPVSAESLADGILDVLRSPERAQERTARAQAYVRNLHSWERIAGMTLQVLRRVIEERSRSDWN